MRQTFFTLRRSSSRSAIFLFQTLILIQFVLFFSEVPTRAQDEYNVWPDRAPGVTENQPDVAKNGRFTNVTVPTIRVFVPKNKTSDACIMIFPGGGYVNCGNDVGMAQFFANHGMTAVLLKYRVPRPQGGIAKHVPAFQDAQRAIRLTRSMAEKYGFNPNRIGATGGSAGGHLTVMCCTSSSLKSYEPVDEIDALPANLAFGIARYPAYVLDDGRDASNGSDRGNHAKMVEDFVFDAQTPPMCFLHGDADVYSPMGSVALYHKLRTMNIPAELHIWANAPHGFGPITDQNRNQVGAWQEMAWDWIKVMKFN